MKTDIKANKSLRPRGKAKQYGSSTPYTSYSRPILERLEVYENVYTYDPLVRQMVNLLTDALIASLGDVEHDDKDINEYCKLQVEIFKHKYAIDFKTKIKEIIELTMWPGFSVSEKIIFVEDNKYFLEDIVTYHPSSIIIRTDKKGRLKEGAPSYEGDIYQSGIYQTGFDEGEVQLPLWKVVHLTCGKKFNNYYGNSIIEPLYRWHILKEAFMDMLTVTVDRYGNPKTIYYVPKLPSGVIETDPLTGEEINLSAQAILERKLAQDHSGTDNVNLVLEYADKDLKPDVKVMSTANNISSVFQEAIKYCEQQQIRSLFVPYGIIETSFSETAVTERQIEILNRVIASLYNQYVIPFISQSLHTMVKLNFNRPSAKRPPRMPLRKATRPEDRVALMQMIKGLTEMGYFNPTNPPDWSMVREMVDALDREQSSEDIEFIKQLLIYPRQPKQEGGSGSKDPSRDRTSEGKKKVDGKPGRSTGSSSPLQTARPVKASKK